MNLGEIKELIEKALLEEPTGNDFIDARYYEQLKWQRDTLPYYKLFYLISQTYKPNFVVELGSYQGTAAAHFAAGNPMGDVITIDIHREDKEAQKRVLEAEEHFPNLTYLNMWTWEAVPLISSLEKKIDILFIDAWHDYEHCKTDWDCFAPFLNDGALIILDDVLDNAGTFEGMEKFWEEVPYEKFLDTRLHRNIPMGFVNYVDRHRETDSIKQQGTSRRGRPSKKS